MNWCRLATVLTCVLMAACDVPTQPEIASADASLADVGQGDANGNGITCKRTLPVSGRSPINREVELDDQDGSCPPGFTPTTTAPTFTGRTVVVGEHHACALDAAGMVWCWGAWGVPTTAPTQVAGATALVALASGAGFGCGLDPTGQAWCWGAGSQGTLGAGPEITQSSSAVPVLQGELRFVEIDAAINNVCGRTAAGQLYCWGLDNTLQLAGAASSTCSLGACSFVPVAVHGSGFHQVSVGGGFICGVSDGSGSCWGWNAWGQLGTGAFGPSLATPQSVGAATDVSAGGISACSVRSGEVYCWGTNNFGVIGAGSFAAGTYAPTLSLVSAARIVAVSDANTILTHACAISMSGEALCWGADDSGQLGIGGAGATCASTIGSIACTATPAMVSGGYSWAEIELGNRLTCGRTTTGDLYCWGRNNAGQVGDGTTTNRSVPTAVLLPAS